MASFADVQVGNACGYIEEVVVAGLVTKHQPKKNNDTAVPLAQSNLLISRKFCILPDGHGGGHSYRIT